jgi:perosamine synthetase
MKRLVPPAGAPLPARTIARALGPARVAHDAAGAVLRRLGVRHAFWLSSGRAALTVLLRALSAVSVRREVVIPAYTCFSVPSAIARAGLLVRLCDVDPKTLDLDLNALVRLDLSRVLCIVPSGLYGLPADLAALQGIARSQETVLVDDAAQTLGATQDGQACGTFGEAGFYSLGRGKNITTMGGGILVTRSDELAGRIGREVRGLPRPTIGSVTTAVAGALAYAGLASPDRYRFVDRLPFVQLGGSRFDPAFPISRLSAFQRRLAAQLLPFADRYNTVRRHHAERLRAGIDGAESIEIPRPAPGGRAVYLRFPLLTRDTGHRTALLARLRAVGIGASASYPTAIGDIPGIDAWLAADQAACPAAASVAARILTLPTHPSVTPNDIEQMVAIVHGTPAQS